MSHTKKKIIPAYAIHPGEILQDELEARGITQLDLAKGIGLEPSHINELIKGKRDMNAAIASRLSAFLDEGPDEMFWLNLQNQYDLDNQAIAERAIQQAIKHNKNLKRILPAAFLTLVKEACNADITQLQDVVLDIFGCEQPDELPSKIEAGEAAMHLHYRKSEKHHTDEQMLYLWTALAQYKAKAETPVVPFSADKEIPLLAELQRALQKNQHTLVSIKDILASYGIIFLHLPKAGQVPVDGISFMKENNPCIVITLRHKQIDRFAFTLFHELGHVFLHLNRHPDRSFITSAFNKEDNTEAEANQYAANHLISPSVWESFNAHYPSPQDQDFHAFGQQAGIHPRILLGRYCFENKRYRIKSQIPSHIR